MNFRVLYNKRTNRGHTIFEGRSPLCPPLPGKVIELSFSTSPKTLSPEIRFGTGIQRGQAFGNNFGDHQGTTSGTVRGVGRVSLEARSPGTLVWRPSSQSYAICQPGSWNSEVGIDRGRGTPLATAEALFALRTFLSSSCLDRPGLPIPRNCFGKAEKIASDVATPLPESG